MTAGVFDLVIDQGADWQFTAIWCDGNQTPIPILNYTGAMMIKDSYLNPGYLLSLSTSAGGITIIGASAQIFIEMTALQTKALPANIVCYYDLFIYSPALALLPTKVLQGKVTVRPAITV